jgi:uncharacterized protein (TIGR01777 family)
MDIFITGGTGFVGSNMAAHLHGRGHRITAVSRSAGKNRRRLDGCRYISADTTRPGKWQEELKGADVVVNLAGATIFKRWTAGYKKQIYDSRILTTRNVVAALPQDRNVVLCSASGAGYYGSRGDVVLTEDDKPGDDFLAGVSVAWEKEALQAADERIRVAVMRFGVILGEHGGALAKMIPAFKSFLGGPLGNGRQWFPWIHIDDLTAAVEFVIEHREIEGALNFCAPNPVRNRDLAKAIGAVLKRPAFMPAPAFMIRMVMGEFGGVLLDSQRTVPDKLQLHGFDFQYPDINSAVQAIVGE